MRGAAGAQTAPRWRHVQGTAGPWVRTPVPRTSPVFLSKENPFRGGHGALRPGRLCASLAGNLGLTAPAVKCAPLVADCCAANQHRRAPHGLEVRNRNALLPEALGELRSFTFPPPRGARNPPVPHPIHLQSRQWPAEPLSAASPRPGLPLPLRRRAL